MLDSGYKDIAFLWRYARGFGFNLRNFRADSKKIVVNTCRIAKKVVLLRCLNESLDEVNINILQIDVFNDY